MAVREHPKGHSRGLFGVIVYITRQRPSKGLLVLFLLVMSGLAESIGLVSLLPLLEIVSGTGQGQNGLTARVTDLLAGLGLRTTAGLLLVIIVVGVALKGLLMIAAVREAGNLGSEVATRMRLSLIDALARARWSYFTEQPAGRLTNTIGVEAVRVAQLTTLACNMVARALQVGIYLFLALAVSWQVTVLAATFGIALFLLLNRLVRKAREAGAEETKLLHSMVSKLSDGLGAMKSTKAMGQQDRLKRILRRESEDLNSAQRRQVLAKAILPAVQEPAVTLVLAVGLFAALRAYSMPIAELLFIAVLFHRIVTRMGTTQTFYQGAVALESAFWSMHDLIGEASTEAEQHTGSIHPTFEKHLRFEDVAFGYDQRSIIERLSFQIEAGTFVSIAGPSGVGKTTLLDLIVGLVEPTRGRILADETSLRDVDLVAWRSMIGYVSQDPILLHESILANVTLGDPTRTEEDVLSSLAQAGATGFIENLPDGIHTVVGERGIKLSGGQRQRLAIARALIHKPRLLLLDEATTALDPATETEILSTLADLKGSLTVVAISHQEAVRQVSDQHLVLT